KRIARQLLMENAVLGVTSGAVGVLLAYGGVLWIVANGPPDVPRLDLSSIDRLALAFACGIALLSSFLFGLAPALRSASMRLSVACVEGASTSSGSRDRVRSVLVVGEIARSEEHTSELQSPDHLVCRLPLEKKNHMSVGCGSR